MMTIKAGGRDIETATNLGAAMALQQKFNKNIQQLFENIDNYNIETLITMLYVGVKIKNPQMTEQEFKDILMNDDNFSYMSLTREVLVFMRSCMSIEKTEAQVREFVDKYINKDITEDDIQLLEDKIDEKTTSKKSKN